MAVNMGIIQPITTPFPVDATVLRPQVGVKGLTGVTDFPNDSVSAGRSALHDHRSKTHSAEGIEPKMLTPCGNETTALWGRGDEILFPMLDQDGEMHLAPSFVV
ncbi:MAG: hypothetical protein DVB23_001846 [Verrucomicrobia bacterium]|jgi:hypothetical protein|nr:MAG: hypothetical protein DVB23_001846 [Verrucomicrobiota bacterium]